MRIRIFQPIVPEYRVALFNGVGRRYGADVEVWASDGAGQDKSYPLETLHSDYAHPFKSLGPLRWQKGLSLHGLKKGDVIVVCGDVHQLSSLWIAAKARLCGIGVVWWGQHVSFKSNRISISIRLFLTRLLSDVVLCYTRQGIDWYAAHNWSSPVFATGNTIDLTAVRAAITEWTADKLSVFQQESGLLDQESIVFCSVLRWKTRLDQLLCALATEELKNRGTKLIVIGDGEGRKKWQKLADDLGLGDRVVWVGELRDQRKIAPWFLSAKAYVYPGPIGLSIIHAFSYGLPVVCHHAAAHHGPEFEAMTDAKTGYVFKENDVKDLSRQIVRLLKDEQLRLRMGTKAQEVAFAQYGIESMIDNYCKAIESANKEAKYD